MLYFSVQNSPLHTTQTHPQKPNTQGSKVNENNTPTVAPSHEVVQIMLSSRTQLPAQHILDQSSNESG